MKEVELYVSSLVESQFPSFYKEEGEMFVAFVKAYFDWLEETGTTNQIGYETRKLPSYRDIDTTLDKFIENFQYKYLQGVPREYAGDRRTLQKHIKEIYSSKGSPRGLELLFRLLFNEDINVYVPGDDVLKPSDGDFVVPRYLEMQFSPYLPLYVNKPIRGRLSGATGIVNDYQVFLKENSRFDILYISNVSGEFQAGEEIINSTVLDDNNLKVSQSPLILGSLSDIIIIDGGINFKVGDTFDVDGFQNGTNAKAVAVDVRQRAGFVTFDIRNSGFGFSNTSTLSLAGFSETLYPEYMPQISLERTSAEISVTGDVDLFDLGEYVDGLSSGARGIFVSETISGANRTIFLRRVYGNFTQGEIIKGNTSETERTVAGEDLVSEASFKIGELLNTRTELLTGIRLEQAMNVAVSWTRSANDIIVNHKFHCLRDGDKVVVKTSSDTSALPQNPTANVTIQLSDLAYSINSTAMFITANNHSYDGSDTVIVRSCSNNTLINSETIFDVNVVDSNTISIAKTATVANVGTVNLNDYYTIVGLNGGATSGTATIDMTIDAPNYGGWADAAVKTLSTINASVADPPDIDTDIQNAIKFGQITYGKIADERASPSGLSSVFGGDGYKTNVLVSIIDPIIYGLRRIGEPRTLSGTVSVSGTTVTGTNTKFTKELIVGSEVYFPDIVANPRKVSAITSDTQLTLDEAFKDIASNSLTINNQILHAVTYWGRIDVPASELIEDADVYGVAGFGKGTVSRLAIINSGIGYQNGEQLTLYYTKDDSRTVSAYAIAEGQGEDEGYFRSNRSFLNSNKYIHDNRYYQEFSYEVQSSLPFSRYSSILREIWHPAGISKFGRVIITSTEPPSSDSIETEIQFV